MLTWLLPGLFSTSGRLAAILAWWWHSRSTGDDYSGCLIEDQSWIDCIDITSRWDTFVLFHLYGNKGVSLPLWPIRPRWFHTFCPCAEPPEDGHEGMWARFGSQGSIALNWHSRYSGTRYSGTWLYKLFEKERRLNKVMTVININIDSLARKKINTKLFLAIPKFQTSSHLKI